MGLIEHHIRTDYIQCGMCHKEFENEYDLEDHEETHRDSPWSDFICETCGEAIPYKDYAQIHYFCHNTPEILEGIRKYKGDIFKLMMKVAPEIISDKIGVLEIKEDKEALAIRKALEVKDLEERRRKLAIIIEEDKEALAIEKDKKASEESIKKAEEEALKIKRKEEIEEVKKIPVEKEVIEIDENEEANKKAKAMYSALIPC